MLVSVVIPVYNSAVLAPLAERIGAVFAARSEEYEIVFVDDASTAPEVWPTLERLATSDRRIRAVQLTRNFGQQAATLCGLRESRGDLVVTMDDDLQHEPEEIPRLLASSHRDIVIAQLTPRRHGGRRRVASRVKALFDRAVIGTPKGLRLSSFRLLRRVVVEGMVAVQTAHPFIPALMFDVSRDAVGVPVSHRGRPVGRSGYTPSRLLGVFGSLLFHNSTLLRFLAHVGALGAPLGLLLAILAGLGPADPRLTGIGLALLALQFLLVGLVLVGLGAIGEHLFRIVSSSEKRPAYVIRGRAG